MKPKIVLDGLVSLVMAATHSPAWAANPGASGESAKTPPAATLQVTPGSSVKRITLTSRAAERLGIEIGKVGEQPIVRKQMLGGLVVPPMESQRQAQSGVGELGPSAAAQPKALSAGTRGFTPAKALEPLAGGGFGSFAKAVAAPQPASSAMAGFARAAPVSEATPGAGTVSVERKAARPAGDETWLLVTMTQGEWERVAKDKPARVLPLTARDKFANEILARPAGMPPQEDSKRSMLKVYYIAPGKDHGLALNKRLRVELVQSGNDETHKVVPYSAVYYDPKGSAWVYVNPQPLVFERQRIAVERTVGDVAVLSEGPPVGTPIVITGASLLYGVEIFGK